MYDYKTDEWQGTAGVARSGGTPFPSLEEWAINSGFRDKAIALARSDKPGVNDPVAAVFLELDTYARKSVDLHDTIAEQEITEALNAVTATPISPISERLATVEIQDRINQLEDEERDRLANSFTKAANDLRQLNGFREEHGITRDATYPENSMTSVVLVIFTIFVETIANAFFFKDAFDGGYLGGAMLTLFMSIVNVGLSRLRLHRLARLTSRDNPSVPCRADRRRGHAGLRASRALSLNLL